MNHEKHESTKRKPRRTQNFSHEDTVFDCQAFAIVGSNGRCDFKDFALAC